MENLMGTENPNPMLTAADAERMILKNLPPIDHHREVVEEVASNSIRVRLPFRREFLGTETWQDGGGNVFFRSFGYGIR